MAASDDALQGLHAAVATALTGAIAGATDEEGNSIPPSAAHLAAAITFLKNNNITADANTNKGLTELKDALAARRKKKPGHLALVEAEEDMAKQLRTNVQ